ncbi:BPSS1187 family protein [Gallaecimonas mangrovi]|uniref:BPSS1187 family protein n=1 Tax=Gallaecimonas mangrovi TaxID=2291597 RepID=UPI00126013FC|nr:hypothetical protein [Gallaecimonas mangrovi]
MRYPLSVFLCQKIALAWFAFVVSSLALPARADDIDQNAQPLLLQHEVAVSLVDAVSQQPANKMTGQADSNLVVVAANAGARKGRLFLFIDGTGTSPAMTKDIALFGAKRGYNVISIAYPNNIAIAQLCDGVADKDCSGKVREEMLTGVDHSPVVAVAKADAIEPRLLKTLIYLRRHYPTEGWGKFLQQGRINWGQVSVAGHSQGAGFAAMIAKRHEVLRLLMISGVADVTQDGATAPWLYRPGATPAAREYGLSNFFDPVVRLRVARASWNAMGLGAFGSLRSVDRLSPPYLGSHELLSSQRTGFGMKIHLSMVFDKFLPRTASGAPYFEPVWAFTVLP